MSPNPATESRPQDAKPPTIGFRPVDALLPYARNARTHSPAQVAELAGSIDAFGWTNPVLADAHGIVAGHGRVLAARLLYEQGKRIHLPNGDTIPAGTVPVIDCAGWTEPQRRAYILADNKLALNSGWDDGLLKAELEDLKAFGVELKTLGFDDGELAAILEGSGGEGGEALSTEYTTRIEVPIYTPKGDKPAITDLVDRSRATALLAAITAATIPDDEKSFLALAAARHVVFNYGRIAEFYCHASPETQRLMEDSALVIIDINRAIERGYVELSKRLDAIYANAYGMQGDDDDETEDPEGA